MKIYSITGVYTNNTRTKEVSNKNTTAPVLDYNISDTVSFGNYNKVLQNMTRATLKHDSEAEKFFTELLKNLKNDKNIKTTKAFKTIADVHKKSGFRGLLNELWKAYPSNKGIQALLDAAEEKSVVLAYKGTQPVMELNNLGRYGFFGTSSSPRNANLSFTTKKDTYYMEFGLEKNGELSTWQRNQSGSVYTRFHESTGNRKIRTEHPGSGNPESTYFNKDGSLDKWKNFLYGGPVTPNTF